ncbi:S-layer homology domain-containing protein [Vallitalea pronyensis]|uniref:S-layer homology domain-containing protein n=1 Tax=Vallitalea pronyensis TaxID=1348613 RepID=A0A8J8MGR6_9FIRM|nr:S-layer homology domain-containing protein [Vallitalea pronyensis]QUI21202.1 S-layer homology domain-containing protein [Vallitalea pronyensis]
MKKFRSMRIIGLILVVSLLLSNVAMAKRDDNKGRDKSSYTSWNKKWEHKNTKRFDDVDKQYWANQYIERMAAKNLIMGDGNGRFNPYQSTKNIEAIAMIIRIMGWEDEAKAIKKLPDGFKHLKVPKWSIGYIVLAYKKGLINDAEIEFFNADESIKRYVVAKYIIRALGMEEEALASMDKPLDYKDAGSIPLGNSGYIYLISKLELMSGYKNKFRPNAIFSRAEMATLFSRLDDKIESEDDKVEMGEYVQVVNGIITITKDGGQERYLLSENVLIYDMDGKEIAISDLQVGSTLQLEFYDHKVVYIETIEKETDKILQMYDGNVIKVVEAANESIITILDDGVTRSFVLGNETVIKKEGHSGVLQVSDIKINDMVKIIEITEGNHVMITEVEIQVSEPITTVYEGPVYALTETTTDKLITILKDNKEKTFVIKDETVIKVEGKDETVEVSDINIGDTVKITEVEDHDAVTVTEIEIQVEEPVTQYYEGQVISLAETTTEYLITIRVANVEKTFAVGEDVVMKREDSNETITIDDIAINDDVKITEVTVGDDANVTEITLLDD